MYVTIEKRKKAMAYRVPRVGVQQGGVLDRNPGPHIENVDRDLQNTRDWLSPKTDFVGAD